MADTTVPANTNQLIEPASLAVASMFENGALRAAILNTGLGCLCAPVAVTNAAYDTLQAIALAVYGQPASYALRALAKLLINDGSVRSDLNRAAKDPSFFGPEEMARLIERSHEIAAVLKALAENPASAVPHGLAPF